MRFSSFNQFYFSRSAASLAAGIILAGCATRKPATTPPTFPPTSEAALREFASLPPGSYDRLQIITVAAEIGEQLASAIKDARESAAGKGANALVVLRDNEFTQKAGQRTLRIRRITYLAIHRR